MNNTAYRAKTQLVNKDDKCKGTRGDNATALVDFFVGCPPLYGEAMAA